MKSREKVKITTKVIQFIHSLLLLLSDSCICSIILRAQLSRLAILALQPCFSMLFKGNVLNLLLSSMYVTAPIRGHTIILVWSLKKLICVKTKRIDNVTIKKCQETKYSSNNEYKILCIKVCYYFLLSSKFTIFHILFTNKINVNVPSALKSLTVAVSTKMLCHKWVL